MFRRHLLFAWLLLFAVGSSSPVVLAADEAAKTVAVGLARREITPSTPVRLTGYNNRQKEFEGVDQRLWAKAIAIGSEDAGPLVMITVDNLAIPSSMTDAIAARLATKFKLQPERFVICASHTHCAPALVGPAQLILEPSYPDDQRQRTAEYTAQLAAALEQVATDALNDRKPARLSWAEGKVGFAVNRRVLKEGRWTGFGVTAEGPVEHRLPVLRVTDEQGQLRAVLANYACHCTTLSYNRVHSDWAGCAQEAIEAAHPGALAMMSIGCAGDANPNPRGEVKYAEEHGRALAAEVDRLLAGKWRDLPAVTAAQTARFGLPLAPLPTREEYEQRAAQKGPISIHAKMQLDRLSRGEKLATEVPYRVTTWTFGNELSMVFLAGEVVVDYALRLRRELPNQRLWISAYTNDVPCYIASRRILNEGGYEAESSMYYYDRATRLAPEAEDLVINGTKRLLPPERWEAEIAKFEAADRRSPPAPGGIVFVGSSSIGKWPLAKSWPNLPVLNRGFGGSHLADSVLYAPRIVVPCKPRMVVLYAGDNDLGAGKTPEQVAGDFHTFATETRAALPEATILYLSVKPSPKRLALIDQQRTTNRLIAADIASRNDARMKFVDVFTPMLDAAGQPRGELFVADRLHMNEAGYRLWTDLLQPYLSAGDNGR